MWRDVIIDKVHPPKPAAIELQFRQKYSDRVDTTDWGTVAETKHEFESAPV